MSLVVTGNPGVGKHTISKKLAKDLNYKILDINKIAIESKVFEKQNDILDVNVIKLKKILKNKITENTIVVGHLAPYVLSKNQVKKAIILRKNPYKLLSVYKKRKYSAKKISENLGSEILGVIAYDSTKKFGKTKSYQIDSSSESVTKIVNSIKNILKNKSNEEKIDWLTMVTEKNDLQKFFSY